VSQTPLIRDQKYLRHCWYCISDVWDSTVRATLTRTMDKLTTSFNLSMWNFFKGNVYYEYMNPWTIECRAKCLPNLRTKLHQRCLRHHPSSILVIFPIFTRIRKRI
jgi:hypothetical protein